MDFVFLQARDRGDSRLQPFATFSQHINPWKVTCKPTQQQFCTCLWVERLKHSWLEHHVPEQWGLVGTDGSSDPLWSETWMNMSALALPCPYKHTDTLHLPFCKASRTNGNTHSPYQGFCKTFFILQDVCVAQSFKTYNRGMRRSQLLSQTGILGLPVRCIRGQTAQLTESSASCSGRSKALLPRGELPQQALGSTSILDPEHHPSASLTVFPHAFSPQWYPSTTRESHQFSSLHLPFHPRQQK